MGSLLLDALLLGRPRASQCPLLQLPSEILAKIFDKLHDDFSTLNKLALVNSDYCRLARARQCAVFDFDLSGQKLVFINHLYDALSDVVAGDNGRRFVTSWGVRQCNFSVDHLWARHLFPKSWSCYYREYEDMEWERTDEDEKYALLRMTTTFGVVLMKFYFEFSRGLSP